VTTPPVPDDAPLTPFEEAFLAAIRASPLHVRRAMAAYVLRRSGTCKHGFRDDQCMKCLFSIMGGGA
jgi:hypothetical protein